MLGLNIHILSFRLNKNLVQSNDKVRVSITTFPENLKEAIIIDANKLTGSHHFLAINITEKTEKLLFVFRKKSLLHSDPIIASTVIYANQLPTISSSSINTEVQDFQIYEPIKNHQNDLNFLHNRKVYGQMSVQFSISHPLFSCKNGEISSKVRIFNENDNQNNFIFFDSGIVN